MATEECLLRTETIKLRTKKNVFTLEKKTGNNNILKGFGATQFSLSRSTSVRRPTMSCSVLHEWLSVLKWKLQLHISFRLPFYPPLASRALAPVQTSWITEKISVQRIIHQNVNYDHLWVMGLWVIFSFSFIPTVSGHGHYNIKNS